MITVTDAVVRYPAARVNALDGASFEARAGCVTALVGPNGSGKSTIVRALIGQVPLATGHARIGAFDCATADRRALARTMAVVAQREEPAFPLPARDYVMLGRYPHHGTWSALGPADVEAVDRAAHRAGAESLMDRRTDALSGGEWQRVRLARALAQGGEVLVLDEPGTFLDVAHEMAAYELLEALAREGRTVLLVSHQLNLVARFAAHIVLLHHGRVAAAGAPADVMRGEVLEPVYDWPLVVARDPAVGAPVLIPLKKR
ncbi:MAG: ABC transporter ATP-binding protein [Gemmatimonadetes bacterium]|nr:ABC transporter ATP-binding protein [Gemmatimonadota bacterium]